MTAHTEILPPVRAITDEMPNRAPSPLEVDVMRDVTHENTAYALDRILALIEAGEDESGDAFRFLKAWHNGKPLDEFERSKSTPAHIGLLLVLIFTYVTKHPATIRPLAFGKQAEVARLIRGY